SRAREKSAKVVRGPIAILPPPGGAAGVGAQAVDRGVGARARLRIRPWAFLMGIPLLRGRRRFDRLLRYARPPRCASERQACCANPSARRTAEARAIASPPVTAPLATALSVALRCARCSSSNVFAQCSSHLRAFSVEAAGMLGAATSRAATTAL